ncbi:MAG: toast rack family protein, partial [Coriobacteriia bacterium]|nr:toast rack family protein [Coriobacteriia bacterium]
LVVGEFEYVSEWRPEIEYDVSGDRGVLVARQPDVRTWRLGDRKNSWDIEVSQDVPIDLRVTLGAGLSNLDLRDVIVKDLDATMGAGDATVDLGGARDRSFSGRVETGAGRITVRLPKDVGVRITGYQEGVGEFSADGFEVDGRALVNDAYGVSDVTIELQVVRGIGETVFELVD